MANYSTEVGPPMGAKKVGQIAGHFRDLQGLRMVPFGIWVLVLFAGEMLLPLSREGMRAASSSYLAAISVMVIGAFAVALVAYRFISGWYRRQFGTVEPTRHQRLVSAAIGGVGTLLFLVPMNVEETMWYASNQTLPLNAALFTVAFGIIWYWFHRGRALWHYLALGGLGLVLGLASMAGVPPATWPAHLREATLYIGVVAVIGGLLDHRVLSSSLSLLKDQVGKET